MVLSSSGEILLVYSFFLLELVFEEFYNWSVNPSIPGAATLYTQYRPIYTQYISIPGEGHLTNVAILEQIKGSSKPRSTFRVQARI